MAWRNQITLRQLRALDMVARTGTFQTAADMLGLTGPAVHNQLKQLEEAAGATLITRQGNAKSTPTAQGQVLIDAYHSIRATLDHAASTLDALSMGQKGAVVLGVVSTAKYFGPRIVALLKRHLPDVDITLKVGNRSETIKGLEQGAFDLCIMGRPPREPLTRATPLADHPHVIVAAADHPLAQGQIVSRDELRREDFVMRETGSGTRILTARYLEEIGHFQERTFVEMDSNETIKQSVINGLGLAMLSAHTVAEELRSGRLKALRAKGLPIMRKWYLLEPMDRPVSPASRAVQEWIVEHEHDIFPDLEGMMGEL